MKSRHDAGRYNLKGKKHKLLKCKCCEIVDFREKYFKNLDKKQIRLTNTES